MRFPDFAKTLYPFYSTQKYNRLNGNQRADFVRLIISKTSTVDVDSLLDSDDAVEKYYSRSNIASDKLNKIISALDRSLFDDFINSIEPDSKTLLIHELQQQLSEEIKTSEIPAEKQNDFIWNVYCSVLRADTSLLQKQYGQNERRRPFLSDLTTRESIEAINNTDDMTDLRKILLDYTKEDPNRTVLEYGIAYMANRNNAELRKTLIEYLAGDYDADIAAFAISLMAANNSAEARKLLLTVAGDEERVELFRHGMRAIGEKNNAELRKLCISLIESGYATSLEFDEALGLLASNNQTELSKALAVLHRENEALFDYYFNDRQIVVNKTVKKRMIAELNLDVKEG